MSADPCPKCHYKRRQTDLSPSDICPACGIVYHKWLARQQGIRPENAFDAREPRQGFIDAIKELIFDVPQHVDPTVFWGRMGTLLAMTLWSLYFMSGGVSWERIGSSFLHNVNLPFHEFGHVFFSPFGEFLMILGGSLFQVALPLVLMVAFSLYRADNFGAAVMLWWSGQNFIDVSPYIADAQDRVLPLVGGRGEESHDWGNLLVMTDSLANSHDIARCSFLLGCCLMLLALAWAAYIGYLQNQNMKHYSD